jgi:hypothetical protein
LSTLCSPPEPIKGDKDDDASWKKKQRDYAPLEMAYTLETKKCQTANKKCMAFIKNTIEQVIRLKRIYNF